MNNQKQACHNSLLAPMEEDLTLNPCNDIDDQIHETFHCCICLELLYKPVVLACGHMSCFWCVHASMSGLQESHCPICRDPFIHFPSICHTLHFLLLKMSPLAYKRREKQVLEEENYTGFFSPEIPDSLAKDRVHTRMEPNELICSQCDTMKISSQMVTESANYEISHDNCLVVPEESQANIAVCRDEPMTENGWQEKCTKVGSCKHVTVADVVCTSCKLLLIHPVILHCGHVYCKSCLAIPLDGNLKCDDCQTPHPGRFPKVCLELDHFLEEQLPKEYSIRREEIQVKIVDCQEEVDLSVCATLNAKPDAKPKASPGPISYDFASLIEHRLDVNVGVGCDSCGMYPIIGKWYRCKDCLEKIGFDLCETCYNTTSKLPGRFNQRHTPDHTLMLVQPERFRGLLWRLVIDDGSAILAPSNDEPEEGHESIEDSSQNTDPAV